MPQLVLEYSKNIHDLPDFKALFLECHKILEGTGAIRIANCKSRAVKRELFLIGDGMDLKAAFVHLELRFVAERSLGVKQAIGKALLETLSKHFAKPLQELALQITVNISSMDKETYFKIPEGSFSP